MFETQINPDYEAIMKQARQLRAEAMRDFFSAIFALFRRKHVAKAVHA